MWQKKKYHRFTAGLRLLPMEERNMSEFGSIDINEMQKEHERVNTDGNKGNFLDQFVPMPDPPQGKKGSITVRILPPAKGGKLFQYNRYQKVNGRKVHCPRPLTQEGRWDKSVANPLGDYYSALWRKADKVKEQEGESPAYQELVDEARSIKPVERYYYNAIVRELTVDGKTETNVGPRILSVGKTLHGKILTALFGDDTEEKIGNVTDLKNGYDFVIRVMKVGDYPKYDDSGFAREPSPAGSPEEISKWAENLHDLTKFRVILDEERLEKELAIHRGLIADEVAGFDIGNFDAKFSDDTSLAESSESNVSTTETETTDSESSTEAPEVSVDLDIGDIDVQNEDFLESLEEFKTK